MKKLMLTFSLLALFLSVNPLAASATPVNSFVSELRSHLAEQRFVNLYNSIDYGVGEKPKYEVFRKAFIGYLNLLRNNKLANPGIITCIDFSIPSVKKRLWIVDLKAKKVLFHDFVAHGKNSGENMATTFSNVPNSLMSSLGFYVTDNRYTGKHGLSLRLSGQEAGFNDKAMERAVVLHGADYVNTNIIKQMGRLGKSFGCPAVSREIADEVINTIADGSCLFIYYPDPSYLKESMLLSETEAIDFILSSENLLGYNI